MVDDFDRHQDTLNLTWMRVNEMVWPHMVPFCGIKEENGRGISLAFAGPLRLSLQLFAIKEGLLAIRLHGLMQVIIESDSSIALILLNRTPDLDHLLPPSWLSVTPSNSTCGTRL
ncbi:hypothetical protein LguiB_018336 [Lonicera macranthoides]